MNVVELLDIASSGYPDECTRLFYNKKTGKPKYHKTGDTLAKFVVIELFETYEYAEDDTEEAVLDNAIQKLETAKDDLESVIQALRGYYETKGV